MFGRCTPKWGNCSPRSLCALIISVSTCDSASNAARGISHAACAHRARLIMTLTARARRACPLPKEKERDLEMDREREKRGIGKGQETESKNLVAGGFDQSLTGQAPHGPVVHRARALRAVEILRAGVPVEHRPFHSGPSAFGGDLREPLEHCLADSAAPILLEYEKIFQVESRTAAPSRIGTKKKREAERLAFVLRNQTFEGRVAIFHLCAQPGGSCLNRFGLTLELRQR